MARTKTMKELGIYKNEIHAALLKDEKICNFLLGDTSGKNKKEILDEFKKHVKSHLFIDEIVTDADMFIYYDVFMPNFGTSVKTCQIILYFICHRDMVDEEYIEEGYYGNRVDIGVQMIEDILLSEDVANKFGIGEINLDGVTPYNATRFYGKIMEFSVPNFR